MLSVSLALLLPPAPALDALPPPPQGFAVLGPPVTLMTPLPVPPGTKKLVVGLGAAGSAGKSSALLVAGGFLVGPAPGAVEEGRDEAGEGRCELDADADAGVPAETQGVAPALMAGPREELEALGAARGGNPVLDQPADA